MTSPSFFLPADGHVDVIAGTQAAVLYHEVEAIRGKCLN